MMHNHVVLNCANFKIPRGILGSALGMPKAMQSVAWIGVMPIVQKIVMKQGAADKLALVHRYARALSKRDAHKAHAQGMF